MSFDEKCRLCGKVVNSFGDVDWDATEEDYRIYLEKLAQEEANNVVICTYCWDRFTSESQLAKHIESFHTGTRRKAGGG